MKVILMFIALACLSVSLRADDMAAFVPLKKGVYWVYRGTVIRSSHTADGKLVTDVEAITWRSEVVGGPYSVYTATAWLLRGTPMDLTWSAKNARPRDHLIFQIGTNYYDLAGRPDQKDDAFDQLKAGIAAFDFNPDSHADEIDRAKLLCEFPLAPGKRFEDSSDRLINSMRTDRYCWNVESVVGFDESKVRGFPHLPHPQVYELAYRTSPDDCEMEIVPGIGIVGYHYHHHGTPMQVELELVEYHSGP